MPSLLSLVQSSLEIRCLCWIWLKDLCWSCFPVGSVHSATPNHFTAASALTKLCRKQTFRHSRALCAVGTSASHWQSWRLVFSFLVSERGTFQNAGMKCFHFSRAVLWHHLHVTIVMHLFRETLQNCSFLFWFGVEGSLWSEYWKFCHFSVLDFKYIIFKWKEQQQIWRNVCKALHALSLLHPCPPMRSFPSSSLAVL